MAKATINTGASFQPVHTRTTSDDAESQAVVVGIDGSDSVVPADATHGLRTADGGTYGYDAGTSAGTVQVPSGARLRRVSVLPSEGEAATVTIGGGDTITIPVGGYLEEDIPGACVAPAVVIAGSIDSYYVAWTA